jgi:predicted DNA-binding protein (MmcQ/YjbR family)
MKIYDVRRVIEALPGATGEPNKTVTLYKIMGKMFAIVWPKGDGCVILKCDPHLAEVMREEYSGVGHRSHLDRRYWIAVDLVSDVPDSEIARLVAHSYEQVRAGLTKKQQAGLAALA